MSIVRRFPLALALSAIAGACFAQAAPAHKVAIVSTVGDAIHIVVEDTQTGTHINQNHGDQIKLPDATLDRPGVLAAQKALQAAEPGLTPEMMVIHEETKPGVQAFLDGDHFVPPADLAAALAKVQATHVVLINKLRDEATFRLVDGKVGHGKVEGMGFYLDYRLPTQIAATGANSIGFLGPFVSAEVHLVDAKTGQVLHSEPVRKSEVITPAAAKTGADPWDTLTPAKKVEVLQRLLGQGVEEVMPAVLQPLASTAANGS